MVIACIGKCGYTLGSVDNPLDLTKVNMEISMIIRLLFSCYYSMLCSAFQPSSQPPKEFSNSNASTSFLMPHLQNLVQQTSIQQVKEQRKGKIALVYVLWFFVSLCES